MACLHANRSYWQCSRCILFRDIAALKPCNVSHDAHTRRCTRQHALAFSMHLLLLVAYHPLSGVLMARTNATQASLRLLVMGAHRSGTSAQKKRPCRFVYNKRNRSAVHWWPIPCRAVRLHVPVIEASRPITTLGAARRNMVPDPTTWIYTTCRNYTPQASSQCQQRRSGFGNRKSGRRIAPLP